MQNELLNHLVTQQIFACDAKQIHKAAHANMDMHEYDDFYVERPEVMIENGIATISIQGLLTNGMPKIYEKMGLITSYETIKSEIESAILAGAQAIQFNINSGGGSVNGAIELSRYISRLTIPTASMVTSCACSAAYMIACATNYIEATETAQIGNIGAIMTWDDYTKYDQQMGIEEKAIYNNGATLKSTFHTAPNDEQIAFLQDTVNQHGEIFNSFVKSQRSVVEEVFKAGWYYGEKALQLGLIDKIKD